MAEPISESAPQLSNAAPRPKGILPGNLQNWFFIGGGVLVVLFIVFNSGGSSAKDKKATAAAKPVVLDPSQARIQEYRKKIDLEARKLEAEQERLQQVQQSMGIDPNARSAGTLQAMYPGGAGPNQAPGPQNMPASPPVDPIKADREKREYASLFAPSVALSYRPGAATPGGKNEKTESAENAAGDKSEHSSALSVPSLAAALENLASPSSAKAAPTAPPAKSTTVADSDTETDDTDSDRKATAETQAKKKTKSPAELRQADGADHRLFEGTVLETVLTNRIAGDFSGPVNCLVSTNVYSHNRQHLLIPQGSRVLGEVKRVTNFGQQRVAVFFHRLIMPDGFSVDLDRFEGLNQIGETGLKDQVNHHYVAIFGSSLALGAIAGFSSAGASTGLVTNGVDAYREGLSSSLSQSSQRILDRFLNQLPTITIREGYRVKVYLTGDLLLPDYAKHRIQDDL